MRFLGLLCLLTLNLGSYCVIDAGPMANMDQNNNEAALDEQLLFVNLLNRHSDRAPFEFFAHDRHAEKAEYFWPRGLGKLTEAGEVRMYNIGLALRRMYGQLNFGDFNTNNILALSSNVTRCKNSQNFTMAAFYDIVHESLDRGFELARLYRNKQSQTIKSGMGSMRAWKQIKQNGYLVPSLDDNHFTNSKYLANHPSKVYDDLEKDSEIKSLENIGMLRDLVENYYKSPFNYLVSNLWTEVQTELYLERTNETIDYVDHYANWITNVVKSDGKNTINLYELIDVVSLMAFVRTYNKPEEKYLRVAPIYTSLIESHSVALGEEPKNERAKNYVGKHTVLYSTHDDILETMLYGMDIMSINGSTWADRLLAAKANNASHLDRLLQGLESCQFGLSLKFELWMLGKQYPVVRLSIYNNPDPYATVHWTPVALGSVCRRRYTQMKSNDSNSQQQLEQYYPNSSNAAKLNVEYDCPFELFKEIYSQFELDDAKYERLYNDEQQ